MIASMNEAKRTSFSNIPARHNATHTTDTEPIIDAKDLMIIGAVHVDLRKMKAFIQPDI